MRIIPAALQAKLDAGETTLCVCWRVDPRFGPSLGFTDHDRSIQFDGLTFEADSGFSGSGIERSLGLSIDNTSATGAISSEAITEIDIRMGRFDGAEVRRWLVDWTDPSLRILEFRGEIGDIKRGAVAFEAELRGLSERLNRPIGRQYLHVCDAVFGDGNCQKDASDPKYRGQGTVTEAISGVTLRASGLSGFETGWFSFGVMAWTSGPYASQVFGVRRHVFSGGVAEITLDRSCVELPPPGATFEITAGCDKRLSTCREKFANVRNFRGFPYMPGESWLAAYPNDGGVYEGGSGGGQ